MPTPHKHAAIIKAWADGVEVQVSTNAGWYDLDFNPNWCDFNQYRIKPEPAAPKWPQTTMTAPEIRDWFQSTCLTPAQMAVIINGVNNAIGKECQSGALVPADKVRDIEAKARAEGKREGLHPVAVIQAACNHMRLGDIDADTIQIILLKAAQL